MIYNSTIRLKEKTCIRCGKPCYWFSKKRCEQCARIENALDLIEKQSEVEIKSSGLSDLIIQADDVFSKYIRLKYADHRGFVQCYTCPIIKHWTLMQCGHYIKRGHSYLRFDDRNARPQCFECNCDKKGNTPVFIPNLEAEKPGITDILNEEMRIIYKPTREELRAMIVDLKNKVKRLKSGIDMFNHERPSYSNPDSH